MYANSPVNASLANAPMYGGGYGYCGGGGYGKSFAIIVVLFVLLIIVGCSWAYKGKDC
ncbi:YjcZ family sporulation protein [Fictibacillus nanhaiensis]|jgi:uncharacterized protein (TIGR01732 family)|nr:YjcZ family sporulation protein [Fictibacillus sp. b24]MDM5317595.1 YjcZ family sporulation protein [Fictibacillus sp. b24]MED1865155.1 YjcZ family sporulation protein [Fictibacillus nanhaiensis]